MSVVLFISIVGREDLIVMAQEPVNALASGLTLLVLPLSTAKV